MKLESLNHLGVEMKKEEIMLIENLIYRITELNEIWDLACRRYGEKKAPDDIQYQQQVISINEIKKKLESYD